MKLNDIIGFGKYTGKTLQYVIIHDLFYYETMVNFGLVKPDYDIKRCHRIVKGYYS